MKEYPIHSRTEFDTFVGIFNSYFSKAKISGAKFKSINIIVKQYRKSKSPQQHKYFFALIAEMQKAWIRSWGESPTKDELTYLVKYKTGFTKMIIIGGEEVEIPLSIADKSEDIDSNKINKMIDFIIMYCARDLEYEIEDPR